MDGRVRRKFRQSVRLDPKKPKFRRQLGKTRRVRVAGGRGGEKMGKTRKKPVRGKRPVALIVGSGWAIMGGKRE